VTSAIGAGPADGSARGQGAPGGDRGNGRSIPDRSNPDLSQLLEVTCHTSYRLKENLRKRLGKTVIEWLDHCHQQRPELGL
jgi:hypothetical protein